MHPLWKEVFRQICFQSPPEEKRAAVRTFTCATCGETLNNRAPYNTHVRTVHQQRQTNNRKRSGATSNDAPAAKKPKRMDQTAASKASEPSASPHSAPQASVTTAGSSWEADPVLITSNLVSSSDEDIRELKMWTFWTRRGRKDRLGLGRV